MKLRTILAAFAVMASGSLYAQNATKADLDKLTNQVNALSQKVTQLETNLDTSTNQVNELSQKLTQMEANLERVITENVNLVEQLNIKTVTSVTDKNGIQWDIVKVEPDKETNKVMINLRLTNNTGLNKKVFIFPTYCYALDSDTNRNNNKYEIHETPGDLYLEHGIPVNATVTIKNVPITSSYLSLIQLGYTLEPIYVKFTGVHIPW